MSGMRLYDTAGHRLYLSAEERAAFLAVARRRPARDRTLCETLLFTGCRPSELVEITPARVNLSGGTITIRSLKKRKDASGISTRQLVAAGDSLAIIDPVNGKAPLGDGVTWWPFKPAIMHEHVMITSRDHPLGLAAAGTQSQIREGIVTVSAS